MHTSDTIMCYPHSTNTILPNFEVILQDRVLHHVNQVEFSTIFYHVNLYRVMSKVLNSNSESCLRQILFERLSRSKKSLQHVLFTNYGHTSKFFTKIHALQDLEHAHNFLLLEVQDTLQNFVMSLHSITQIVVLLIRYVYQKISHSMT